MRRVLDDRYPQAIVVAQIALLATTLGYAFDLLDLFDFEACVVAEVAFDEESNENGPLGVRVYAAAGAAFEGGHEEGCAGRWFEDLMIYEHDMSGCVCITCLRSSKIFLAVKVHDKHVGGLHELFLHAAGRDVDLVFMANAGSSAGTCDLAKCAC
jgi:hypothetical protein